jgi:hypothetical protein
MDAADFMALVGFIKDTMIVVWGGLDQVVIVDDGTYRLTALTLGIGIAFLVIVIKIINHVRSGKE